MLRSVLAVLGGYFTLVIGVMAFFAVLMFVQPDVLSVDAGAGYDGPAWVLWAELAAGILTAAVGGYVCAWIAAQRPIAHGVALAVVMGVLGVLSAVGEAGLKPLWSSVALAVLPPLVAIGGAAVRARVAS